MTDAGADTLRRVRKPARVVFVVYAVVLVVATHWPELTIDEVIIERPDLVVHFAAFFLLTALLIVSAPFGPPLAHRNILLCAGAALVFAAVDEATQALPGLNRFARLDDYGANAAGVLGAGASSLVLAARGRASPRAVRRAAPQPSE